MSRVPLLLLLLFVLVCGVLLLEQRSLEALSWSNLHHVWSGNGPGAGAAAGTGTGTGTGTGQGTQMGAGAGVGAGAGTGTNHPAMAFGTGTGAGAGAGAGDRGVLPLADPDSDLEAVDREERPGVSVLWSLWRWVVSGAGSDPGSGVAAVGSRAGVGGGVGGGHALPRLLQWPELSSAPPALQLYLKYHSLHALHSSVLWTPSVCSHRVFFVQCGSGNYGTTMMRLLMALKIGIITNTTIALVETPMYVSVRWLSSARMFDVARVRMGCPRPHWEKDPNYRHLSLDNPWKANEFWALSHKWKQHNCSELYYPGDSVSEREEIKRRWSQYYLLRCSDVFAPGKGLLSFQYLHLGFGDQWQAVQLLEQNPYFRALNRFVGQGSGSGSGSGQGQGQEQPFRGTGPTIRPYIPDDDPESVQLIQQLIKTHDFSHAQHRKSLAYHRSDMVCDMFRLMFRVDVDVADVIERITGSKPFDYYFHIRSIRGGGVIERQPLIIRQLQSQWAAWNQTHKQQQQKQQQQQRTHTNITATGVPPRGPVPVPVPAPAPPPSPSPHPPRRIYILLDYGNRTETCRRFEEALPWLTCHYFSVSEFMSRNVGVLPGSLAPWAVSPAAAGQGWGAEPLWAALVDMYAVYGSEYGWSHPGSAYGRLVGWNARDCQTHRIRNYDGSYFEPEPYREF